MHSRFNETALDEHLKIGCPLHYYSPAERVQIPDKMTSKNNDTEFSIEKNVPVESRRKYPFSMMEIGDSFFAPSKANSPRSIRVSASSYARRHKVQFQTRECIVGTVKGLRIWRVK